MSHQDMANPRLHARIAGFLYLIVVAASTFALIIVSDLIEPDAATSAANIAASEPMFRLAFAANLAAGVCYTAVVAILFVLFKPVHAALSAVAAFMGLAGCASSAGFMLHSLAGLSALDSDSLLAAFGAEQVQATARHSLRLGALGNSISLVFFGTYCVLLGWLVLRANFLPRFLGALLILAGAGWLTGSFALFLAPEMGAPLSRFLLPVSGLGEFIFTLWLLAMGVDSAKWRAQASAA